MKISISVLMLLSMSVFVYGQKSWTKINPSLTDNYNIEVIENSVEGMVIKLSVNSYRFDEVVTPNGTEIVVKSPKCPNIYKKGSPDLPFVTAAIAIPDQGGFKYDILSSEFISINDINIAPSKGTIYRNVDPATVPYEYGNEYQINEFFPYNKCNMDEPYIIRDIRGSNIKFYPFIYNAISNELKIYTEIIVKIKFTSESFPNQLTSVKSVRNDEFNSIYDRTFVNYRSSSKYTPLEEGTPGNILIICKDTYASAMTNYINWKREKGIETEMVLMSAIGTTATQVETYIQNYYNNTGLTNVLLVGDAADVPTMTVGGNDSDNGYTYVSGTDGYADIFIGRFSGNTLADIQTQVDRTVNYEKELSTGDTWLGNSFGSASNEGEGQGHDGGESDATHMNNIKTDLQNYGYTVTSVYQDGGSNAQISAAFNSGIGSAFYVGHGDITLWANTSYSNTEVNALTNAKKLPYIFSVACVNGAFNGNTCFAEAWMRATSSGNPTGAVAFLGSTINQSWTDPMTGEDEMCDILLESYVNNIKRTFGGISFNGMFQMIEEGGEGQSMADTWLIFGDPSLMVRTMTPSAMTITHGSTVTVGMTNFTVNCDVDGALVSLTTLNGLDVEIIGTGYVSGGSANITIIPFAAPGTMKVTVTAFNKVTYQEDVLVIVPDGPYVVDAGYTIDDSDANNNGLADYNESFYINQSLENVGVQVAEVVNASITISEAGVVVSDNNEVFGDITVGETITKDWAFAVTIPDGIADQTMLAVNMDITDANTNEWAAAYTIPVNAPDMELSFVSVDDSGTGNGNGTLDAGETVTIYVEVLNSGHSTSPAGTLSINTINEYITINDNETDIDAQPVNTPYEVGFEVIVGEGIPNGESVCFNFVLTTGLYGANLSTCLSVGQQIEDWESGTLTSFAWVNESTYPWSLVSDVVYEGDYALQSGLVPTAGGESILTINLNVLADDNVEFYKKVNCQDEMWGYVINNLQFTIDGTEMGNWYGVIDWSAESHPVLAGNRELKWMFYSMGYVSTGDECAWIDNIKLPAHQSLVPVFSTYSDINENSLDVYPNPASNFMYVNMNLTENTRASIKVINISGQVVFEYPEAINLYKGKNSIVLNTENYSDGLYIIQVCTDQCIYSKNLIISR